MKKFSRAAKTLSIAIGAASILFSCSQSGAPTSMNPGENSTVTGFAYDEDGVDGYPTKPYYGQPDGPNLRYIEGGRSVMGSFEEDLLKRHDNAERTVTVASFYMDETEIANIHWLEYLHYLNIDSGGKGADAYINALPDTLVWKSELAYNDPYVDHYLRYPGFRFFPVVGVTWEQADAFAEWRTLMVNYKLADEAGVAVRAAGTGERIPLESGVVLPNYRLPSEAEWEYAAKALIGNQWLDENQTHSRLYPWDGHALRNPYGREMGTFLANFKRGRGDYAGIAGKLNDGAMITDYIYNYPPNDFNLFNMAGNVNEWVGDVYRANSFQEIDDLNPFRRNGHLDEQDTYQSKGNNPSGSEFKSLVSDKSRVYKGGSWKDVAYWMSPGTRRFLDQDSCTATIGFRCAMIRAGTNY